MSRRDAYDLWKVVSVSQHDGRYTLHRTGTTITVSAHCEACALEKVMRSDTSSDTDLRSVV